jgi:hypothetical protein
MGALGRAEGRGGRPRARARRGSHARVNLKINEPNRDGQQMQ